MAQSYHSGSDLVLAQEPVVFWRVLRRKLGSSAGGDSLRFLVDFLKPERIKKNSGMLSTCELLHQHSTWLCMTWLCQVTLCMTIVQLLTPPSKIVIIIPKSEENHSQYKWQSEDWCWVLRFNTVEGLVLPVWSPDWTGINSNSTIALWQDNLHASSVAQNWLLQNTENSRPKQLSICKVLLFATLFNSTFIKPNGS